MVTMELSFKKRIQTILAGGKKLIIASVWEEMKGKQQNAGRP